MTGRSLESGVRELTDTGTPYSLAYADLTGHPKHGSDGFRSPELRVHCRERCSGTHDETWVY
jgi:hypothetical protein